MYKKWNLNWDWHHLLIALILFGFYLVLPTKQSTIDGFGYASYIRDADSLFLPHHLLYNSMGYLWVNLLELLGISNPLGALKTMNALFAALSLVTLGKIFYKMDYSTGKTTAWTLFVGSSWGVMRFATENETYILPIFLSLLATYYFLLHCKQRKTIHLFLAGFLAAFACLIHQIHFFWWLAMLATLLVKKEIRKSILYAIPAIIVPIGYILVLALYYKASITIESLAQFALRDFYTGSATVGFGFQYLFLSAISFTRSFIQVHGYLGNLLSISAWYIIGLIGFVVAFTFGLFNLKKLSHSFIKIMSPFGLSISLAFALQLAFAIVSHGNAEFMVMLPFLSALIISQILTNEVRFVGYLSIAMLIWNLSFGLIPLNRHNVDGSRMVANKIGTSEASQSLFLVFSKPRIDNMVRYLNGNYPSNTFSATQVDYENGTRDAIVHAISKGKTVYTDCIDRPRTISRESLTISSNPQIFNGFNQHKVDSINTLTGKYYLFKLMPSNSIQIRSEN